MSSSHDVEDILDFWENTGLLYDVQNPLNLALLLHTQCRVNESTAPEHYPTFKRCSIPALIQAHRMKPNLLAGLVQTDDCTEVFRLGFVPRGSDEKVCQEICHRLLDITESRTLYFGGVVAKDNRLYLLLADEE